MRVWQHINFASNLTNRTAITAIDTRLTRQNTLADNALFKRLKFVLDVIRRRTVFNGKRLDDSIFDLTYTLVSRGFLGDAVCLTQISTRGFFNLCSQCLVNLGR